MAFEDYFPYSRCKELSPVELRCEHFKADPEGSVRVTGCGADGIKVIDSEPITREKAHRRIGKISQELRDNRHYQIRTP